MANLVGTTDISGINDTTPVGGDESDKSLNKFEDVLSGAGSEKLTCKGTLNLELKVFSKYSSLDYELSDYKGKRYVGDEGGDAKETEGIELDEKGSCHDGPKSGARRFAPSNTIIIKKKNCKCNCHCAIL